MNNPSKEFYTFDGWIINNDAPVTTVTINQGTYGNRTYTAKFTPATYTITLNGGSGATVDYETKDYNIETADFTLPTPTKTNYAFVGWILNNGDPATSVTIPLGTHEDRTYIASWSLNPVLYFNLSTSENPVILEMRRCPAGSFVRSDSYTVSITKDFYMGTYEVTNAQYRAIIGDNPHVNIEYRSHIEDNYPVECVKYDEIIADGGFINLLNNKLSQEGLLPEGYIFALPTEAQWEYACRANTTTDLNSGKNIVNKDSKDANTDEVGWNLFSPNNGTEEVGSHVVGGLASNSFGLYDMHGNVFELCNDWYAETYDTTDLIDPKGPPTANASSTCVIRGGAWEKKPKYSASYWRVEQKSSYGYKTIGFRLALVNE